MVPGLFSFFLLLLSLSLEKSPETSALGKIEGIIMAGKTTVAFWSGDNGAVEKPFLT